MEGGPEESPVPGRGALDPAAPRGSTRDARERLRSRLGSPQGRLWLHRCLCLVAVVGFFSWVRRAGDFHGYLLVGDAVLSGGDIYRDLPPGINTWPPAFSLFCVPLAVLARPSVYLARGVWLLLNLGALLAVIQILVRTVFREDLSLRANPPRGIGLVDAVVLVPLLLTSRYVFSNLEHLQINILLFGLSLGGLYLQGRGRCAAGGVALGTAAALKVMPVLFLPYLVYRKRWQAAFWMALTTALISLSPALVYGVSGLQEYYGAWREAVAAGWTVGKMNQSVFAMLDRFIGHGMIPLTVGGMVEVVPSGAALVKVVWWTLVSAIGALCLWAFRKPVRQDSWSAAAEWSVIFIVSAIFGPVGWKAYLVVLLLPMTVLFALARSARGRYRRVVTWILTASFVLGALPSSGLIGKALAGRLEMSSAVTLSALVVLFGSIWLRAVLPEHAGDG